MSEQKGTKVQSLHPQHTLANRDIAQLASGLAPVPMDTNQRANLKQRVLQAAFATPVPVSAVVKADAGTWIDMLPGIHVKALHVDRSAGTHTSLWRLAPGACLPEHDHSADEECLIVSGSVDWAGKTYGEGDYLFVGAGFHHSAMCATHGATLLIRGELTARLEHVFAPIT